MLNYKKKNNNYNNNATMSKRKKKSIKKFLDFFTSSKHIFRTERDMKNLYHFQNNLHNMIDLKLKYSIFINRLF